MGDFNHGHIQWTYLQSTGREDQEFFNLVPKNNQGQERVGQSFEHTEGIC